VSILKENPSDIGAYVGLANFLIGRDRLEDAEKQIDAAMALQPNELQLWVVRGELEIARGEIDKAIEYFEEARSRGETSLAVFLGIGQALTMKGENKKAAKVFREGLAVNQDSPEVHFNIALVEEQMGNDDLAEIHYLLALQRGLTQTGMAHNNLGGIYARQGKIRDAVLEFRKALAYNPDHLHALFNLAHLLFTSGGYMEAKKLYIRALNIAPDLVPAHRELSMVDQLLGDWEGAFISERAISRIVPTDPTPWLNMAQIKMKLNQSEEARKYLDAAISRGGKGIMTVIEKDKSLSPLLPKPIPKANDSEQTSQDPRNPEKTETSGDGTSSGNGDSPQQ
jgi:Tfp pilus assembly protein PilF